MERFKEIKGILDKNDINGFWSSFHFLNEISGYNIFESIEISLEFYPNIYKNVIDISINHQYDDYHLMVNTINENVSDKMVDVIKSFTREGEISRIPEKYHKRYIFDMKFEGIINYFNSVYKKVVGSDIKVHVSANPLINPTIQLTNEELHRRYGVPPIELPFTFND